MQDKGGDMQKGRALLQVRGLCRFYRGQYYVDSVKLNFPIIETLQLFLTFQLPALADLALSDANTTTTRVRMAMLMQFFFA